MNKILIILILTCCFKCFSQNVPQAFKYQAVARDNHGSLIKNESIVVHVSILDSTETGNLLYKEQHNVSTNAFGLFNLQIGTAAVLAGNFASINWGSNDKYLSIEIDFGNDFQQITNSQLLSVPYALYSGNPIPGPQGAQGIQGIQGLQGNAGPVGLSLTWLGSFALAPTNPILNAAYYDSTQKKSFVWDGISWQIISKDGNTGPTGPQGLQGIQGITGPVGLSLTWLGSFTNAPSNPNLNDAYYDSTQKKSLVWNGVSWQIISLDGNTGPTGPQGLQGIQGVAGPVGLSLTWLGSLASAPTNPSLNAAYYNTNQKKSFVWDGITWQILAQDGNTGPQGSSFLKNFQFVTTANDTLNDTTDIAVIEFNAAQVILPLANSVANGKILCLVCYGSSMVPNSPTSFEIISQGGDLIRFRNNHIPITSISLGTGSGNSLQGTMLVSDGVSKWYYIGG